MEINDFNKIVFELPISYEYIKECSISEKINEHVKVRIVGVLTEAGQSSALDQVTLDSSIHIYTDEKQLFYGIATSFEITYKNGVCEFILCAADESIRMDIEKKCRSFQNINQTYAETIKNIIHDYHGDYANAGHYVSYPQTPMIQYEETDWQFIKRLASNMGIYIQPEAKREGIQVYLGEHEGYTHNPTIYEYVEKRERKICESKLEEEDNTQDHNCQSIWITTPENYDMGDKIELSQVLYTIIEKTASIIKEQLLFTYRIQRKEYIVISLSHNKEIKGVSIEGTILAINEDRIKLHLNIDEEQEEEEAYEYPFAVPYTAEGDTGWYMMPPVGEKVLLYIPSQDERDAYIATAIHCDEESNPYRKNPSVHRIGTEDDKSITISKEELSIQSDTNELYITILEDEGVSIVSDEDIQLVAGTKGNIRANTIQMYAKDQITFSTKKTSIIMDTMVDISGDNQRKSTADAMAYRICSTTRKPANQRRQENGTDTISSHENIASVLSVANTGSIGMNKTIIKNDDYIIEDKIKVNKTYPYSINNRYILKLTFKTDPMSIEHSINISGSEESVCSLCSSEGNVIDRFDNSSMKGKNIDKKVKLDKDKTYQLVIIVKDKTKKRIRVRVGEKVESDDININLSDNYLKWLTIAEGYTAYPYRDMADNSDAQARKNVTLGIGFSFDKKGTNWEVIKAVLRWSDEEISTIVEGVYNGINYCGTKYEITKVQVYEIFKRVSEKKYIPNLKAAVKAYNQQRSTKMTYSQQELEAMFDFSYNNGLSPTKDTGYTYSSDINNEDKIIYYYLRKNRKGACAAIKRYGNGNRRRLNQMNLFFFEDYTFLDKSGADLEPLRKKLGL